MLWVVCEFVWVLNSLVSLCLSSDFGRVCSCVFLDSEFASLLSVFAGSVLRYRSNSLFGYFDCKEMKLPSYLSPCASRVCNV